jgi:hypothetical protein
MFNLLTYNRFTKTRLAVAIIAAAAIIAAIFALNNTTATASTDNSQSVTIKIPAISAKPVYTGVVVPSGVTVKVVARGKVSCGCIGGL